MDLQRKVVQKAAGQWEIPFTQFMRPTGWPKPIEFLCTNAEVAQKAQKILDAGLKFTCEVLMTDDCVFYITGKIQYDEGDDPEEGDMAMEIVRNGPKVPAAVDKLILDFTIPEDGIQRRWK